MQERFKLLLEEKRLTATQFAAMIKVNASAMSHILNGRSKPSFDVLAKIAQAFPDVNLNFLISGEGHLYNRSVALPEQARNQPIQTELFTEEKKIPDSSPDPGPQSMSPSPEIIQATALASPLKKLKRIILFFEDGSFEDYTK